jgi:hypothetical protein
MQMADLDHKSADNQHNKQLAQLPQRPTGGQLGLSLLAVAFSFTALIVAAFKGQTTLLLSTLSTSLGGNKRPSRGGDRVY